jgi:hypothetical protein
MDDGSYATGGLGLCTDNFSLEQVQFLCNMLHSKLGIVCNPQARGATK